MTSSIARPHDIQPGYDRRTLSGPGRLDKILVFLGLSIAIHTWALSQGLSWLSPEFSLDSRSSPASDQGVQVQLVSAPAVTPAPQADNASPVHPASSQDIPPPATAVQPEQADVPPAPAVVSSTQPAERKQRISRHTAKPAPTRKTPPSVPRATPRSHSAPDPAPPGPIEVAAAPASAAAAVPAPLLQTEGSAAPLEVRNVSCDIPQPRYPVESRRKREQGLVVLNAVIDANGDIDKVQVAQSSGYSALDRAARQALQQARCAPYIDQGQRIAVAARLPVAFNLNSSRQP